MKHYVPVEKLCKKCGGTFLGIPPGPGVADALCSECFAVALADAVPVIPSRRACWVFGLISSLYSATFGPIRYANTWTVRDGIVVSHRKIHAAERFRMGFEDWRRTRHARTSRTRPGI